MKRLLGFFAHINENPTAVRIRYAATSPLGNLLVRLGVRPTLLNLLGLVTGFVTAALVAADNFSMAAIVFTISILSDGLDGVVARALRIESDFGTFFDAVCDRYVDTAILLGISWHFINSHMPLYTFLTFATILGTVVTSYARARAEALSLSSRYIGLLNRPERVFLLLISFMFPMILTIIMWVMAALSNLTALHRIFFYSSEARHRTIT